MATVPGRSEEKRSVRLGLAPLQSHSWPAGPGVYPPVDEAELFCEAEVRAHEHPHRVTTR
jgi:hypothetical protein